MSTHGIEKRAAKFNQLLENIPPAYMNTLHMNEYLLVLNPHETLCKRIMQVKQEFADKYHALAAKFLRPQIALASFTSWDLMEEKITQRLKLIAMGTTPFKVELKDYNRLPSHSIYINITTRFPIVNLVKSLKDAQRLMKADPAQDPHFINEPYIAIARKLLPYQYEKGWKEYANRHFSGRFIADSMLLLKRPSGSKAYKVLHRLEFQNLPVVTSQGSLFHV